LKPDPPPSWEHSTGPQAQLYELVVAVELPSEDRCPDSSHDIFLVRQCPEKQGFGAQHGFDLAGAPPKKIGRGFGKPPVN
jgi:hypothetical protein